MSRIAAWALLAGLAAGGMLLAEEKVPGQKPLVIIADTFQFVPGAWARYNVYDKEKKEAYDLYFAVLGREEKDGQACAWIEVDVRIKDQPRVVTRFLALETPQGPGDVKNVIVQVEGYSPFTVPKKFLKPDQGKGQVAQLKPARVVKKLERRAVGPVGRRVQAWVVEAVTDDGQEVKAVVSEELPPIALYEAESPALRMTAVDWGLGARTRITGEPVPFWLWLMEQVEKGMAGDKKK
jgi:hypothetical protein